ncbi:TPA: hypothetical protein ACVTHL_005444 [Bacillus cereus]|uniref:hypothetical protein n=1 Tax=Bacillus cereus TaxID=1396 RepID=UPI0007AB97C0|nr:hypothetical protein [Bacillus cereus]KZD72358.1 hypothetical protein B4120_4789 [Bacillus cereus]
MEIKVNEQAQKFHLATNQGNWQPMIGHAIQIDEFILCACPMFDTVFGSVLNISEVTTGHRVLLPIPVVGDAYEKTSTAAGAVAFLRTEVAEEIKRVINKVGKQKIIERIEKSKKYNAEHLPEMPPIEDVDRDWMSDETTDVTH